jgi:PAS domain S-box-containing protein
MLRVASVIRRHGAALGTIAVLLFVTPPSVLAQDASPTPITVGVLPDWPPYYIKGANGEPTGFAIDAFEAVAARAGLTPRYRWYASFAELMEALDAGEIDVIPDMGVIPERHYLFTKPISTFDVSVFVRQSSPKLLTHEDIHGRVAVVQTNVGERLVDELPSAKTIVYQNVREALFRLLSGDVDALVYSSPVVWSLARSAHVEHLIREVPPALGEIKRGIAVARGRNDLRARLDLVVDHFVGSREYAAIYRRWHTPPEPFWTVQRVALLAGVLVVLVGLAGALWRYLAVRKAHERIRFQARLLDIIGEAVIATDSEGKVVFWNRFAEQLYGYTAAEAIGRSGATLTTAPEGESEASAALEAMREGRGWQGEVHARNRHGSAFPARVTMEPILSESGAMIGMVGVSTDLSASKQLEDELRQAQKMESIGRLAGGVAHDFNNLLTVIGGTTEVVMDDLSKDDPHRADLAEVLRASNRAAALTQQLLSLSRKQIIKPRVMDLNAVVLDTERLLRRVIGEDITLTIELGEKLSHVRADPTQIQRVILNLAVNSRDAMPSGGCLTIATSDTAIDKAFARANPWIVEGRYVTLRVIDTGMGMDEATRQHVFEPFFTTKGPSEGTGLGLSTVYGIVQQSGGTIRVQSAPGDGTTFEIYLPEVGDAVTASDDVPLVSDGSGSETILVVEDEPGVRQLALRTLEKAGYEVIAAEGPSEALRTAERYEGHIDLLLTDVVLPEMYGPELVAMLMQRRPEMKVLYMSGYAESTIVHHAVDAGARLINKPFALDELVRTVREVLDAGGVEE